MRLLITAAGWATSSAARLFAIGLVVFTVASALCGFAQDATSLIGPHSPGIGGAILTRKR